MGSTSPLGGFLPIYCMEEPLQSIPEGEDGQATLRPAKNKAEVGQGGYTCGKNQDLTNSQEDISRLTCPAYEDTNLCGL